MTGFKHASERTRRWPPRTATPAGGPGAKARPLPGRALGFSLVEMLVAVAIGGIVTVALIDLLADTKATYVREDQFARMQEGARLATLLASGNLRSNRSLGCQPSISGLGVTACKLLDTPSGSDCDHAGAGSDPSFISMDGALGYDNSVDLSSASNLSGLPPAGASNIAGRWLRGDVFVAWGVDGVGVPVLPDSVGAQTDPIPVSGVSDDIGVGSLALIDNCDSAELFEVTALEEDAGGGGFTLGHEVSPEGEDGIVNATDALNDIYNRFDSSLDEEPARTAKGHDKSNLRATVYPFSYSAYYICCVDTEDRSLMSGAGVARCSEANGDFDRYRPSLCIWSAEVDKSEPMVTDVADLRVTYTGDDFSADDTSPVPTAAWVSGANAWADVRSALVELLLATNRDNVSTTADTPASDAWPPNSGNGVVAADTLGAGLPADRRLYRRVVINVAMRSHAPWYITP